MIKKQSFIKGTLILMGANAVSKILGAVFKIPLTYLLHEEGMAIYTTSFSVYATLLSLIISGMPLAVSKMIAEETALENQANVRKIITVSSVLLGILGIFGSLVLWLFADFFALALKEEGAYCCLKIIAPSVFFVALGTVYKSYYQGNANMTPTAVSQVIEAFVKLICGYGFALLYSHLSPQYTAAAAIMGVTVGEITATFILYVLYLPHRLRMPNSASDKSVRSILGAISSVSVPAILAAAVSGAMNLVDITVIRRCIESIQFSAEGAKNFMCSYASHTDVFDALPEVLSISSEGSRWLYGAYSGYALTVFHLPIGILASLGISILPVISGALAKGNKTKANACAELSLKLTLLVCLPASFVLLFFSEPILCILFKNTASAQMLSLLAPCLVFISLSQISDALLNAGGIIAEPFIFGFIASVIKLVFNIILIRCQYLNILGAVLSADIAYFTSMVFSLICLKRNFGFKLGIVQNFVKPFLCAAVSTAIMYLVYRPFSVMLTSALFALILSGAIGCVTYALMLLCTSCISRKEINTLIKH